MKIDNKLYDILKYICQIALPALATFYFMLAQALNLPYVEQVTGVIAALTTLLGTLLGISSYNYKKDSSDGNS